MCPLIGFHCSSESVKSHQVTWYHVICVSGVTSCYTSHTHRDELVAHFPERNLNAYSAYPLLVNPTHYVGDKEWFSDTEPPIEVLERIRARKAKEEEEEERMKEEKGKGRERNVEDDEKRARRERVRKEAVRRQIEAMKQKFGYKTEL